MLPIIRVTHRPRVCINWNAGAMCARVVLWEARDEDIIDRSRGGERRGLRVELERMQLWRRLTPTPLGAAVTNIT